MSCLRPIKVPNPRYKKYKSSPIAFDAKDFMKEFYIYAPCGLCINCLKRRSSEWRIRLIHECMYMPKPERLKVRVLTLTVAPQYYDELIKNCSLYIRRFLERYRKKYKKSVRHWITTEYGEEHDRLHFHGIFFDLETTEQDVLQELWKYGFLYIQSAPLGRIVYITKYITKAVKDGKLFIEKDKRPFVYCSPGIGKKYVEDPVAVRNSHSNGKLNTQISNLPYSYQMPRYYKQKLFTKSELLSIRLDCRNGLGLPSIKSINKKMFNNDIDYYEYISSNFGYVPVDIETKL